MSEPEKKFLEIETKYDAIEIDRLKFKSLMESLNPKVFLYVEGTDEYYVKGVDDFLRYRMAVKHIDDKRSELTFKKKSIANNNNVREEVNLRIDLNDPLLVKAFCEGLGYKRNFSVYKYCDIYFFEDANLVYYDVISDSGKPGSFVEIEASEDIGLTEDQAWEIVQKYEKILSPLGINAQKRKRLSLFEMYVKYENDPTNAK
jgi:predicted adenylyl cyclase CyaB